MGVIPKSHDQSKPQHENGNVSNLPTSDLQKYAKNKISHTLSNKICANTIYYFCCSPTQLYEPRRSSAAAVVARTDVAHRKWLTVQALDSSNSGGLILQPETRPISQEQLVAEVKGIYAGLVMVESKCIEVDQTQSKPPLQPLNNEQWQALIALHRTLLHEHHDFFLASQHPSASPALRRLPSKYAMPARMWRHGIHSFLELLRHRLPESLEHMLTFIYLAYSMMALLFETVPVFEDTWIECLGDLGRYRFVDFFFFCFFFLAHTLTVYLSCF